MPERSVAPRWYVSVLVALLAASLWSGEADGAGVHGVVVERVVAERVVVERVGVERVPPRLHVAALAGPPHDEVRRFGDVLAANGRLVAIGAPTAGDDALSPGAVHIVRLEDGSTSGLTPILCATFLSREEGEHFGGALAMTRMRDRLGRLSILAIGADRASATAPTGQSSPGTAEGAVEILRSRSDPSQPEGSNPWLLEDRITSTEPEPGAEFGGALAFDSGYRVQLAIGSARHSVAGKFAAGIVEIFERASGDGGREYVPSIDGDDVEDSVYRGPNVGVARRSAPENPWSHRATITAPVPHSSAWFGRAVALDADWLAVGAPGEDLAGHTPINATGAVHLYRLLPNGYQLIATLHAPIPEPSMWFGATIALDGSRLAVGAPRASVGTDRVGAVFVYELVRPREPPLRLDAPQSQSGAGFGQSLALQDNLLLAGSPGLDQRDQNGEMIEDVGACWAFDLSTPNWVYELAAPSTHPSALFGSACAIAGLRADKTIFPIAGHLYVEEEATAPSPGAAIYRAP